MTGIIPRKALDLVAVTHEDDATDDISIRMEHARRLHVALAHVDPKTLLVHPDDNGTSLLVRTRECGHGFTIGTTLARRFDASILTDGMLTDMLDVVLVALDRYGTIDPRQEEHDRRCHDVMECVLHDHAESEPDQTAEQIQLAAPCPWSPACADVGAWTDVDWQESYRDLPEGANDHVTTSVETSVDAGGRVRINARLVVWLQQDIVERGPMDAMRRLRVQSEILRGAPFPRRA